MATKIMNASHGTIDTIILLTQAPCDKLQKNKRGIFQRLFYRCDTCDVGGTRRASGKTFFFVFFFSSKCEIERCIVQRFSAAIFLL